MSNDDTVNLPLTNAEALVLFEWLCRSSQGESPAPFVDQSEQRVLWDIEAMLESVLLAPLSADYDLQLAAARAAVRGEKSDGNPVEFRFNV